MGYGSATNQNANQDESDLWKADSTSFGASGTIRHPNQKRVRCLNKSASGNHLDRNDPQAGNRR
jgi:hypothetical protein